MEKKWVYKSNWDCTLVVKPTTKKGVYDNVGNMIQAITVQPIKLYFKNGGMLVVDENLAKFHGVTVKDLVKLIELQNDFNRKFWLIQSPDYAADEKTIKEIEEGKKSKVKVQQGIRHTRGVKK